MLSSLVSQALSVKISLCFSYFVYLGNVIFMLVTSLNVVSLGEVCNLVPSCILDCIKDVLMSSVRLDVLVDSLH